ncbi:MAG: 30S ribosome-binding factor RbfA [Caldilineaceae bacterium]
MSSEIRQKRVTGLLLEELSIMIGNELADPKLSLVTVTDVIVSKDLHNVRVFVSHDDDAISKREVVSRLTKAAPFLRSQVAERLSLRFVPELSVAYDESPARVSRIQELLQQIRSEREAGDVSAAHATAAAEIPAETTPTRGATASETDGALPAAAS